MSKNILVVGGANGIGWATVKELLKQQNTVIIADCDKTRLKELRQESNSLKFIDLDLSDKASRIAAMDVVKVQFGKIDALVVTAAIHSCHPVEHLTDEMIDQEIEGQYGIKEN